MRTPAANSDWRQLTRLDREALNYITTRMHERYGDSLSLLDIEAAILDAFGTHVRIATKGRELGVITLGFAVIGDIFPPAERGKYQGLTGAAFGLASVIGPTLGGYITDNYYR